MNKAFNANINKYNVLTQLFVFGVLLLDQCFIFWFK